MAQAKDIDIDHLADLARIELTEEEKTRIAGQIGDILGHFERIQNVDTEGVEPMAHAFPVKNVWREDAPGPTFPPSTVLRMAPDGREEQVSVPRVVE